MPIRTKWRCLIRKGAAQYEAGLYVKLKESAKNVYYDEFRKIAIHCKRIFLAII